MKKRSICFPVLKPAFIFLLSLFVFNAKAQVYFGASSGYGFPLAKQMIALDYSATNSWGYFVSSGLYGSFGNGFTNKVFAGFELNEHVSSEIGFEYLSGAKILSSLEDTFDYGRSFIIERSAKATMVNVEPAIRLTIGEGKFKTYIRTGLLIGLNGKIISASKSTDEYFYANHSTSTNETVEEFRGGIAWGFLGGVGVNYSLNEKICFFAEAVVHAQTWSPTKSSITKFTNDGINVLSSLPVSSIEREYKETTTANYPMTGPNDPMVLLKRSYPLSSGGINFGIILKFPGNKEASTLPSTNEQL